MGIFSLFSGKPGRQAAMYAGEQIRQGQQQANTALDEGYNRASDQYGRAAGLFENMAQDYAGGSELYRDALGVNGAEGSSAAREAFTGSAGYGFNLDQGLQALARTRAASGSLASGNADTDAMKYASGLASNEWSNWLSGLNDLDSKRLNATTGEAGTYGQLGNLAGTIGAAKAGVATNAATSLADVGTKGLLAGQQASANGWNTIFGGIKAIGGLFGGGGGSKGSFSNYGN